eukprot:Amastigsp_a511436_11.p4 type:complete len:158 gc:universal Amastigsp_a511436_11:804-331(-)
MNASPAYVTATATHISNGVSTIDELASHTPEPTRTTDITRLSTCMSDAKPFTPESADFPRSTKPSAGLSSPRPNQKSDHRADAVDMATTTARNGTVHGFTETRRAKTPPMANGDANTGSRRGSIRSVSETAPVSANAHPMPILTPSWKLDESRAESP